MHKGNSFGRTGRRHGRGRHGIDDHGGVALLFRCVDARIGSGIDARLRIAGGNHRLAGAGVRQIRLIAPQTCHPVKARKLGGHLTGFAKNKKPHARTPRRSPTPSRFCRARHQSS